MEIIGGSTSFKLAKKVGQQLKTKVYSSNLVRFPDGEIKIRLPKISDKKVAVIQSTAPPVNDNLVELLLILDALKRTNAKEIIAVIPYFGYARQDKIFQKGESLSATLVAKLIETAGATKIITIDIHSERIKNFFKIPVINITSAKVLNAKVLKFTKNPLERKKCDKKCDIVVAPDFGALKRAKGVAEILKTEIAWIEKKRSLKTGKIEIANLKGDVKNKNCLIIDDIISSGITLIKAAQFLKEKGAKKVYAYATHPVFSQNAPKILQNSPFESIIVSNSIEIPKEKQFKKLKIISIAKVLAETLKKESK
jgi:ribose-phosphate pyrophosphokinase